MRPIDIALADLETVRCILREHAPGLEVRAFGSRVSFTARETSDLDLALLTEEPLSIARMTNLKASFTKSYLPFRVDIVDWASTSENFRKVIEREHVVLVERNSASKFRASKTKHLGDCVTINDSTYSPKEEYPFINYLDTGNITSNRISEIQFLHVGSDVVPSRARRKVQPGDIVYSTVRPIQRHYGLLKEVPENFLVSTGFCVIRGNPRIAETDFIYWFLTQNSVIEQLNTIAEQSTSAYPSIKPTDIEKLGIELPPLTEQRAIAHILGTLDDKIELNRRMNKTLEEMAQALFKSWFLDFEPVKAKLAVLEKGGTSDEAERAAMCAISGKDEITLAKLESEQFKAFANLAQTAAQFPSAMQDSELGKIPKDWDACNLGDIVTSVRGRSYRSSELSPSDTALVTLKSFERGGGYRADGLKSFTGKYYANQVVQPGEIVIACTDVTQAADVIGRPAIVQSSNAFKSLVASLDTLIVRPNSKNITRSFLYYLTKSSVFTSHTNAYSTGTTVLHLAKEAIPLFQFPLPPPQLIDTFDKLAKSAIELIRINNLESESLVSTRNCLLPKLVSGEVRVQEFYNQKIQNLEIP